jgi:hypothetical protein
MTTLTLRQGREQARSQPTLPAKAAQVLVQRQSTFGAGGPAFAPAIRDAGRPLEIATRSAMEGSFGRDLTHVRVHDDAHAHDDARSLHARAYTAGDHVVFAEGAYRPDTARGQALIAHEVAHTIQQDGVQTKLDGSVPTTAHGELERQADRAALAATSGRDVGSLGRIGRPVVFRADEDPPAAPDAKPVGAAGSTADLPSDVAVIEETPAGPGATYLSVQVPVFNLPSPKGAGSWVQEAYTSVADGKRLVFHPIFDGKSFDNAAGIKAFKEGGGEKYKNYWLNNYGFTSLKEMADAFKDAGTADPDVQTKISEPGVAKILAGFAKNNLNEAKTDIDHIVEKQLGGSSVPSNLQVLLASKNRTAGSNTYTALVAEINRILRPARPNVKRFAIAFSSAKVVPDTEDPSYQIEKLLRTPGTIKGKESVAKGAAGTPIQLLAGGVSEVVYARASEATPIPTSARALVHGLRLTNYHRTKGSTSSTGIDTVEAELAASVLKPLGKNISLSAVVAPLPATAEPTSGAAQAQKAQASEVRKLTIDKAKNKDVGFYYQYLSAGKITSLEIDDQQNVKGEGVIKPTIQFLGDLKVRFGPDRLDLDQDINTAALNSSPAIKPIASIFRFTSGKVSLDLVKFKPSGDLEFEVGPKNKPVILGLIHAKEEGGAFVATGDLKPGRKIPGITEASGNVTYHSLRGWKGELTAKGSPFEGATVHAILGFTSHKSGRIVPNATGGLEATIKEGRVWLKVIWTGENVRYEGEGTIPKPLPLVKKVTLRGVYSGDFLRIEGTAPVEWQNVKSTATVEYTRRDGEKGRLSGSVDVTVKTDKAEGMVYLSLKEGKVTGKGKIKYWVTKNIRPELEIELQEGDRVKLSGSVQIATVQLLSMWPKPGGERLNFLKVGAAFRVPTPLPSINIVAKLYAEAFLNYGVGPVQLVELKLSGHLYPFEDDPKFGGELSGKLSVPGFAKLGGKLGASLGVEILAGAAAATGGIAITPYVGIIGEFAAPFKAQYEGGAFRFEAEALAEGKLTGGVGVNLEAEISAVWGLLTHTWTWEIGRIDESVEPPLRVTLGTFKYGPGGDLSVQPKVKPVPDDVDTKGLLLRMFGKATEVKKMDKPKQVRDPDDYSFGYGYGGHKI